MCVGSARRQGPTTRCRPYHPHDPRRATPRRGRPRPRLRPPRLQPATVLVRGPPHPRLGARRRDHTGQSGHGMLSAPSAAPSFRMDCADQRRPARVRPAGLDRPGSNTPAKTTPASGEGRLNQATTPPHTSRHPRPRSGSGAAAAECAVSAWRRRPRRVSTAIRFPEPRVIGASTVVAAWPRTTHPLTSRRSIGGRSAECTTASRWVERVSAT